MGAWGYTFDGNDTAADWFRSALGDSNLDANIESALHHVDSYDTCRAAVYLLTVLGGSAYVWPGDLDRLSGFVKQAAERMEAMVAPESEANQELRALWGDDSPVFTEIRRELDALRAAHAHILSA